MINRSHVFLLILLALPSFRTWAGTDAPPAARTPDGFVQNLGQWDTPAEFIARRDGGWVRAEPDRLVLQRENACGQGVVVGLVFENASSKSVEGSQPLETTFHYYLGDDPSRWRTNVPGFAEIFYRDLYPGVDVVVRDHSGTLEYDLLLAPGSDLESVRIRYEGIESISLLDGDRLVLETALGAIEQRIPATWTEGFDGRRQPLPCRYRILDDQTIGFEVDPYDEDLRLVIDPSLEWSTVVGGASRDEVLDHAVHQWGRIFATGFTDGTDFPTTPGAYDASLNAQTDAVMFQLSPDGTTLLSATYIGGDDDEQGNAIAVTPGFGVFIGGITDSSNFPTTAGAFDTTFNGRDGFVLQIDAAATTLQWSSFLGGTGSESVWDLAVTDAGTAFVCGETSSSDFPTIASDYDSTYNGSTDAFVCRFYTNGATIVLSTYVGGSGSDRAFGLALDPSTLDVTVTGSTTSSNFPTTAGAYQSVYRGNTDAFVFRLDVSGNTLEMSTYLGGANGFDSGSDLTIDSFSNTTIVGSTTSSDFPVLGAYDPTYNGATDGFVTNVRADGTGLFYSTFLGGSSDDWIGGIYAAPSLVTLFIAGETTSSDFPITPGAFRTDFSGREVFALRMSGNAGQVQYSTFLGRGGATEIQVDGNGDTIVGGWAGDQFVTTPGAYDSTPNGGRDGFITKLRLGPVLRLVGRAIPGNQLYYVLEGAPSSEAGFRAQVLSSCSGTAGIPLPNSGGLVLPLTFDGCTQLSLNIAVALQGIIQADGTATTPNLTWPNANPGITLYSAAYTLDLVNLLFSSVTPPISFLSL